MRITTSTNISYNGFTRQLTSGDFYRETKQILYRWIIFRVVFYDAEAWILLSTDEAAFKVFEIKVQRKLFGLARVGDDFRIRSNNKLHKLLNNMDIV